MAKLLHHDKKTTKETTVSVRHSRDAHAGSTIIEISTKKGAIDLALKDFVELVFYGLTHSDLEPNDPRIALVKAMQKLTQVESFNNPTLKRFHGEHPKID